jgi:hypothetical protein
LQAGETDGYKAFTPLADGVPIAAHFGGDLLVGRLIVVGSTEDEATACDQSLRSGAGTDQHLQLLPEFDGQHDRRAERTWHEGPPCRGNNTANVDAVIMPHSCPAVQILAANL